MVPSGAAPVKQLAGIVAGPPGAPAHLVPQPKLSRPFRPGLGGGMMPSLEVAQCPTVYPAASKAC
jgi:hypothetical protein